MASLPPELQPLAHLILEQSKLQQETLAGQLKTVGDKLSGQIRTLDVKVDGLSTELSSLRDRVLTLETAAEYKDNEVEQLRRELHNERRERVKSDLLAERYSRKSDVIIRGLPYHKEENCEMLFNDFLLGELGLEKMPLVAVHRLSRPTKTRPNPHLLVRLVNYHDRDRILKEGRKLRGSGYAVYEHLPPPIQAARSQLVPDRDAEIQKAKDTNTRSKISIYVPPKSTYAVLLVNGKEKKRINAVDIALTENKTT